MSGFRNAPVCEPPNRSTRLAYFVIFFSSFGEPRDDRDERPGKSTRATMALMETVGKVAGKVAKFADDYKVRVVPLAPARAIPRGAAPRAIDHPRRPQPYAIADTDA